MENPPAQFTLNGETYVILRLGEYEIMKHFADIAEDANDEAWAAHVMRERNEAIARNEHLAMPRSEWARIRAGESPVRVVREYRGLTQTALAEASGVAQPEISAIESKTRAGTAQTLKRLAKAMGTPVDILIGDE